MNLPKYILAVETLENYHFPKRLFLLLFACLNTCFTFDHQTFLQSVPGQTCHGCVNHDIVIGLCSKLLMWLSYHNLRFGKKLLAHIGIEPWSFRLRLSSLPLDQSSYYYLNYLQQNSLTKIFFGSVIWAFL